MTASETKSGKTSDKTSGKTSGKTSEFCVCECHDWPISHACCLPCDGCGRRVLNAHVREHALSCPSLVTAREEEANLPFHSLIGVSVHGFPLDPSHHLLKSFPTKSRSHP